MHHNNISMTFWDGKVYIIHHIVRGMTSREASFYIITIVFPFGAFIVIILGKHIYNEAIGVSFEIAGPIRLISKAAKVYYYLDI